MDQFVDIEETNFTNHETFFAIAHKHHELLKSLVKERNARPMQDDDDIDFHCAKNADIQRAAMVSVIFSALTLEAFINNYAIERFSRNYFDNHLDKLPTISKWIVIPKLITRNELNSDGQSYECLKKLFRRRDRLVHYKARKKKLSEINEEDLWTTEKQSSEAIATVEATLKELCGLDNTVSMEWLEEAKTNPYV